MYKDLSEYRRFGQLHLVINPDFFSTRDIKEKWIRW